MRVGDQPRLSVQRADNGDSRAVAGSSHALFVTPRERGDGFQASVGGHILGLADPSSGHSLAPTPDDLFVASIASEFAWTTRGFLRAYGLPDDVSVSATWRTNEGLARLGDVDVTVTVSGRVGAASAALAAALESGLAARSLVDPAVHISLEGANR
jgi:uncharacterized OsmC-like protein